METLSQIDRNWTLFLDRDGVLNHRIVDGYVCNVDEWEWLPGVLEALAELSGRFGRLVVVTNQRGIALGKYTELDLKRIHSKMLADVKAAGGKIHAVYFCPHHKEAKCGCRKPEPGMLRKAAEDDPKVDLKRAIMVGDSVSDMEAANALGIRGIFIGKMSRNLPHNVLTALPDLPTFVRLLETA